jgi:hypothetical protein
MIIAYDDGSKEIAMELKKLGFTVVSNTETQTYDSYIYKIHTPESLRNMIDHNENLFLLNISELCVEEVAKILNSRVAPPLMGTLSNF